MYFKYIFKRAVNGTNSFFYTQKSLFQYSEILDDLFLEIKFAPKPNIRALEDFIWNRALHPEETFYQDIKRVPPGYELTVTDGEISLVRWWDPCKFKTDHSMNFEEYQNRFRILFEKAVERCIPNEEILGCELSGGFDSSSVFCIATKKHPKILALTMDFAENKADERVYAESAFDHCRSETSEHFRVRSDQLDYKNRYDMKYNYTLNPHWPIWVTFSMNAPILDMLIACNIKTVLNGQLGDHLLYGSRTSVINYLYSGRPICFLKELFTMQNSARWMKNMMKRELGSKLGEKNKNRIKRFLNREEQKLPFVDSRYSMMYDMSSYKDTEINKSMINALTHANFYMYVDSSFSRAASDKYGIKFLSPFGDQELIEFMLTVPPEYLYSRGNRRHFHAEVMKELLPEDIYKRRSKAEFSSNIMQQIEAIDRTKLWEQATIVEMGLVTKDFLYALENKFITKTLSQKEKSQYWCMINVEYWYALNPYLDKSEFKPNPYVLESL